MLLKVHSLKSIEGDKLWSPLKCFQIVHRAKLWALGSAGLAQGSLVLTARRYMANEAFLPQAPATTTPAAWRTGRGPCPQCGGRRRSWPYGQPAGRHR